MAIIVSTTEGKIKGRVSEDIRGKDFFSFQGIPYAQPPLGHLRFKAPKPPIPWTGIRDCTSVGPESLAKHMITKQIVGSEDCLYLNVYSPEIKSHDHDVTGDFHHDGKDLLPVMFWIHGGVFSTGSSNEELFGPEFLIAENIVLVTINYRLGLLGFLSLDDPDCDVPGNAGFKDMVMALKWVRRNIGFFGGDPNNVTVFGESAGGAAAHLLMLSPMAKGLLHKVICQSGCALNNYVFGRRSARMIAEKLEFFSSNDKKLLDFLQSISAEELLRAQLEIDSDEFLVYEMRLFGAIVEHSSHEENFLPKPPQEIMLSGDYNHVPVIIGFNNGDGMCIDMLVKPRNRSIYITDFTTSLPFKLNLQRDSPAAKECGEKIRKFYFGDVEVNRKDHTEQFYTLVTDSAFLRCVYTTVKSHVPTAKYPIYFYRMALETGLNYYKIGSGIKFPGAFHGDELGYLFQTVLTPEIVPDSIEDISQRRLCKLWANFAKFSNPTPLNQNDPVLNVRWLPVTAQNFYYLNIDQELSLRIDPEPKRMALWDDLMSKNPNSKL